MKHAILALPIMMLMLLAGCQTLPRTTGGSVEVSSKNVQLKLYFTEREKELIYKHYKYHKKHKREHPKKHKHMPPGLAKKKRLPPGLQKRLTKNDTLPPGIQHRVLPRNLEQKMHRLDPNYIRVIVGQDIVLMNKKTRVIFDVILGAALN